jgi:DNA polymerase (family 10)
MNNATLARIFYEMADILQAEDVEWKPQAYRKAAKAIEGLKKDVAVIYKEGGLKALDDIPAVGKNISAKIEEFLRTGKIAAYEKLKKEAPEDVKKTKTHLVGRIPLKKAEQTAKKMITVLKKLKQVKQISVAGSLRRRKPEIGDIDIMVCADEKDSESVTVAFAKMKGIKRVLAEGPKKASIILDSGIQVDLRVFPEESWGAGLMYFTGSKNYNIAMRKFAIKKGFKLNEYGLYRKTDGQLIAGKTEDDIFRALGLEYREPEDREKF